MSARAAVVIVTYNSAACLGATLAALRREAEGFPLEVVVVDNVSRDGTPDLVRRDFPGVALVSSGTNEGFGRACNRGLAATSAPRVLFLNPDAVPRPGALARLEAALAAAPRAGLVAPLILGDDGCVQDSVSYRYPGERRAGADLGPLPGRIAMVLGAVMYCRREALESVGGFDPDYFLYGEDADLCLRLRRAGWELLQEPTAVFAHLGGHSEREAPPEEVWMRKYAGEELFQRKHYGPAGVSAIRGANRLKAWWRLPVLSLRALLGDRAAAGTRARYRAMLRHLRGEAAPRGGP